MNCFSLNCRGAGNKPTVRDIVGLTRSTGAKLVFLSETRQKAEKMKGLRGRLGLKGFVGIDSDGRSGGLALYWHDQMVISVQDITDRYIDLYVQITS
jgi:hypothetical protein